MKTIEENAFRDSGKGHLENFIIGSNSDSLSIGTNVISYTSSNYADGKELKIWYPEKLKSKYSTDGTGFLNSTGLTSDMYRTFPVIDGLERSAYIGDTLDSISLPSITWGFNDGDVEGSLDWTDDGNTTFSAIGKNMKTAMFTPAEKYANIVDTTTMSISVDVQALVITPGSISFDNLDYGYNGQDIKSKDITITNKGSISTGNLSFELQGTSPEAFEIVDFDCSKTLNQNDDMKFEIKPKSGLLPGEYSASLRIFDPNNNVLHNVSAEISLKVNDLKELTMSPSSIELDDLGTGYGESHINNRVSNIEVKNTGTMMADSLRAEIGGTSPEAFDIDIFDRLLGTVDSGESKRFPVKPASGLNAGVYKATVKVSDYYDAEIATEIAISLTVHDYKMDLSSDSVDFGTAPNDQVLSEDIDISNTGTGSLKNLSITSSSSDFIIDDKNMISALTANGEASFSIAPDKNLDEGTHEAMITVSALTYDDEIIEKILNVSYTALASPVFASVDDVINGIDGSQLIITEPSVSIDSSIYEVTGSGWQISSDGQTWNDFDKDQLTSISNNGDYIRYYVSYTVINGDDTVYTSYSKGIQLNIKSSFVPVNNISLNAYSKKISIGESFKLTALVSPDNASSTQVTWTSSNSNIVSVSNGTVTGKGEGKVIITASVDGKSARCKINVSQKVTNIATPKNTIYMKKGKSYTPKVTYSNGTKTVNTKITWSSSKKSVATVNTNTGKIKAKKTGNAIITGATASGKKIKIKVNVVKKNIKAKKIKITGLKSKYKAGNLAYMKVASTPKKATNINPVFKSSNKKVAIVTKAGKVTFKKKGKVTITVKAGGKTVKKKVTVKK